MRVTFDETEAGVICCLIGNLEHLSVAQFRDAVAHLRDARRVIFELAAVPFVDSAGLGALIGGIRRTRELGGDVAVACDRPTLVRLLRTTGFDRIVTVAETVDEAIAALSKDLDPEV